METPVVHRGVSLYQTPWVSGTRAEAYYGPVKAETFIGYAKGWADRLTLGFMLVLRMICSKAARLGANAIVGLEFYVDPFAHRRIDGAVIRVVGTMARLEALF